MASHRQPDPEETRDDDDRADGKNGIFGDDKLQGPGGEYVDDDDDDDQEGNDDDHDDDDDNDAYSNRSGGSNSNLDKDLDDDDEFNENENDFGDNFEPKNDSDASGNSENDNMESVSFDGRDSSLHGEQQSTDDPGNQKPDPDDLSERESDIEDHRSSVRELQSHSDDDDEYPRDYGMSGTVSDDNSETQGIEETIEVEYPDEHHDLEADNPRTIPDTELDGFEDEPAEGGSKTSASLVSSKERRIITCLSLTVCLMLVLLAIVLGIGIGFGIGRNRNEPSTSGGDSPPTVPSPIPTQPPPSSLISPAPSSIPSTKPTVANVVPPEPTQPSGPTQPPVPFQPATPGEPTLPTQPTDPTEPPFAPTTPTTSPPPVPAPTAPPPPEGSLSPTLELSSEPPVVDSPSVPTLSPTGAAAPVVPTNSPTLVLTDLLQLLVDNSVDDGAAVTTPGTPQNEAYIWLRNNAFLDIYSDDQKLTRYALATFFYATNGPTSWDPAIRDDGWLTNAPECQWASTANNQCVDDVYTSLTLDFVGVDGTIPAEVGLLTGLERFSVRSNIDGNAVLRGTIPEALGSLTKIVTIRLNDNNITGVIPTTFGLMTDARVLILTGNELTGQIPSELGNTQGRTLNFDNNRLSGPIPSQLFVSLADLSVLNFQNNSLSGAIPTEIGNLGSLASINFSNNRLAGAIPSEMGRLSGVRSGINLSFNQLSSQLPSEIGLLGSMRSFEVQNNVLGGTIPVEFAGLTDIRLFRIDGNSEIVGSMPVAVCETFGTTAVTYSDCGFFFECQCCTFCCSDDLCECNVDDATQCSDGLELARVPIR